MLQWLPNWYRIFLTILLLLALTVLLVWTTDEFGEGICPTCLGVVSVLFWIASLSGKRANE